MIPADIEKKFIDHQVAEWKRQIYAQRAMGIEVDTLNTQLKVRHDNGEEWEILIKCKRIAAPVKTGPTGLTTWERKEDCHGKEEVIDLSGLRPDPDQLPPTSKYSPEGIAKGIEIHPDGMIVFTDPAIEALKGIPYSLSGAFDSRLGCVRPNSMELHSMPGPGMYHFNFPLQPIDVNVELHLVGGDWQSGEIAPHHHPITKALEEGLAARGKGKEAAEFLLFDVAPFFEREEKDTIQDDMPWWFREGSL